MRHLEYGRPLGPEQKLTYRNGLFLIIVSIDNKILTVESRTGKPEIRRAGMRGLIAETRKPGETNRDLITRALEEEVGDPNCFSPINPPTALRGIFKFSLTNGAFIGSAFVVQYPKLSSELDGDFKPKDPDEVANPKFMTINDILAMPDMTVRPGTKEIIREYQKGTTGKYIITVDNPLLGKPL